MELDIRKLDGLCRICLHLTKDDYVKLNSEASNGITVLGMLVAFTIEEDEDILLEKELPSKICTACFKKLTEAYKFQQTIVKSRKRLIFLLNQSENFKSDFEQHIKVQSKDLNDTFLTNDEEEDGGAVAPEPEVEDFLEDDSVSYKPCTQFSTVAKTSTTHSGTIESAGPSETKTKSLINKQQKIKITKLSKFECGLCDKVYADLKAFKIHFRKHTGERPYLCSFCSKTFADKSGLDKHAKRKHTAEGFKKHQCPYCPRKTSDITHLKTHIQTHTGEKPDVCQICGKAFNGRTALRMHLRIHVEEKKFKCRFCDQAFKLKKYLERHEMIHQNIKPYQCHYCQSAFTQQGDMLKHLKQHDHDTSYKCDQCDISFRLKTELRRHMVVHPRPEMLEQTSIIK